MNSTGRQIRRAPRRVTHPTHVVPIPQQGRGRNGDCSPPPAQIPACAANAPGSSLGSNVRRLSGLDALIARRTTASRIDASSPALSPGCGRTTVVPLGPGPSLHILRQELPPFVRMLLQYYGPVRLLTRVHVQRAAFGLPEPTPTKVRARVRSPRFRTKDVSTCMRSQTAQGPFHTCQVLAWNDVAFSSAERDRHLGIRPVSQLNTQPMVSPVNASRLASRPEPRASLRAGAAG